MVIQTRSIPDLTAMDMMTPDVVCLSAEMPIREAARILLQNRISGAPVVDADQRCIGVISNTDFLFLADKRCFPESLALEMPLTCGFQAKQSLHDGQERLTCLLPFEMCPFQKTERTPEGSEVILCTQPNCIATDWQVIEEEELPMEAVENFMTADPVMVSPSTTLREVARAMIDAHIHRIIVGDEKKRPIGIVTSSDLLAALAYAEDAPEGEP